MSYIIVHMCVAYGPFASREAANYYITGSSMASDPYSIHPLRDAGAAIKLTQEV